MCLTVCIFRKSC